MINEIEVQKKYKDKILEIFKVFVEICETYNLQCFCHGNTPIGVIRHQGFIPWDDDIEVLMPQDDYERFLKLFPTINKNNYELHNPNQEAYYYLTFTKMCDAFNKRNKLLEVQRKLTNYMTAYAYNQAEFVGSYGSQFGVKAFWPKEWFSDFIMKDFEGIKVRISIGYDKLLTQVYGNYMKLPPEEKRVSGHHIAYLNLDKRVGDLEVLSSLNK